MTFTGQIAQGIFVVLFVVFVVDRLHGGPSEVGLLRGVQAVGAIGGGLALGMMSRRHSAGALAGWGAAAFGVLGLLTWNGPAVTTALPVYIALFVLVGAPGIVMATGVLSTIQDAAADHLRGRAFSAYSLAANLGQVVGMLAAGVLVAPLGLTAVLDAQATLYLLAGLFAALYMSGTRLSPVRSERGDDLGAAGAAGEEQPQQDPGLVRVQETGAEEATLAQVPLGPRSAVGRAEDRAGTGARRQQHRYRGGELGQRRRERRRHVADPESGDHQPVVCVPDLGQQQTVVVENRRVERHPGRGNAVAAGHAERFVPRHGGEEAAPPSRTCPIGPRSGETNVAVLEVCVLRTYRAAWISSANTTSAPRPRDSEDAATWTAATRFAGPSGPGRVGFRIAPVTTNGASCGHTRSIRYAVSSSVSVPCVSTTPAAPSATACDAAATTASTSPNERPALGTACTSRISISTSEPSTARSGNEVATAEPCDRALLGASHRDRAAQREQDDLRGTHGPNVSPLRSRASAGPAQPPRGQRPATRRPPRQ